jgi:glycosyltransferase involved in cell wall biosynthesis
MSVKLNLLFVSGTYIPASGGSEISMHTLLVELARRGHHVAVLTDPGRYGRVGWELLDGVPVRRVASQYLEDALAETIAVQRPEVVLTQLMWSERVLRWCNRRGLPTVYFLRSVGVTLDLRHGSEYAPTVIVANSSTTREYALQQWKREAIVVYPVIRLADYRVDPTVAVPQFITMFNPTREKGGHIFRAIAERMPDRAFLAVEGWHHWKRADGSWDMARLTESARSFGSVQARPPEEIRFDDLPNVVCEPAREDVRTIYARTRLLLVPSVWPEPYARVILEAMVNGIPVLHSGTGSTNEASLGVDIRVEDHLNPDAWVAAIKSLDDPGIYQAAARAARERAATYDYVAEVNKVESLLLSIRAASST